jgi:CRISPR-associated protein Csm3
MKEGKMKRLKDIFKITGELELLTGLHIGAGKDEVKIGGIDNPVIRNPYSGEPYIPGSSVKGKMRMLLELYYGIFDGKRGDVFSYKEYKKVKTELSKENLKVAKNLLKLFGTSGSDFKDFNKLPDEEKKEIEELSLTRLSFYDLTLTPKSKEVLKERIGSLMTEEKTEVKINRITGTAFGGALSSKERVPAGTRFDFKLCLKVFEGDNEEELLRLVKQGLKLLELDSLGGSGSRGYGKVKLEKLSCRSLLKGGEVPFDLADAFTGE